MYENWDNGKTNDQVYTIHELAQATVNMYINLSFIRVSQFLLAVTSIIKSLRA
jgi:hypothetical protein